MNKNDKSHCLRLLIMGTIIVMMIASLSHACIIDPTARLSGPEWQLANCGLSYTTNGTCPGTFPLFSWSLYYYNPYPSQVTIDHCDSFCGTPPTIIGYSSGFPSVGNYTVCFKVWDTTEANYGFATVTTHIADIGLSPSSSAIAKNEDDDNGNGTPDYQEGEVTVQGENDLVGLQLSSTLPGPYRRSITLGVPAGISVWSSSTRGTRLIQGPGSKTWDCPPPSYVYLEGTGCSTTSYVLTLALQGCTCVKQTNVAVYDVDLEATATGSNPSLPSGRICLNAQSSYRRTAWRAKVMPSYLNGYPVTASIQRLSGSVSLESKDGSNLNALEYDDEFWVVGNGPEAQAGTYSIKLTCNSCTNATDVDGNYCTKFVYVVNTATAPAVRQSSLGTYTDTSAGGDHDGGRGIVQWPRSDFDSAYLNLGIGDSTLDVYPQFTAEARAFQNATNNVEFWAAAQESGHFQVAMLPQGITFANRLRVQADMDLSAATESRGWPGFSVNLSLGASVLGIIRVGVGTPVSLNGNFGCVNGIGFLWNGTVQSRTFEDTWVGPGNFQLSTPHYPSIAGTYSAEMLTSQSLPFNIPIGFSAGASLKEDDPNPIKEGASTVSQMSLSISNEQYFILP